MVNSRSKKVIILRPLFIVLPLLFINNAYSQSNSIEVNGYWPTKSFISSDKYQRSYIKQYDFTLTYSNSFLSKKAFALYWCAGIEISIFKLKSVLITPTELIPIAISSVDYRGLSLGIKSTHRLGKIALSKFQLTLGVNGVYVIPYETQIVNSYTFEDSTNTTLGAITDFHLHNHIRLAADVGINYKIASSRKFSLFIGLKGKGTLNSMRTVGFNSFRNDVLISKEKLTLDFYSFTIPIVLSF